MKIGSIDVNLKGKIIKDKKSKFRTFEDICLETLKKFGPLSAKEWSFKMGYRYANGLEKVIKRIQRNTPDKIRIHMDQKPRKYEAI